VNLVSYPLSCCRGSTRSVTCLGGCRFQERMTLTLFAAVSLKYSIIEAETYYKQSDSNMEFGNNFGSSASLADQIDQGAPVDIFIFAASKPMHDLAGKELIVTGNAW